ncbi:hypothetical protein RYX36_031828 [Vicia faba]
MVESNGIEIRVQSLTLVIDGLCKRGEVEKAKELMDEMVTKSIVKPTVFTYNTLLNAYVGRKDRSGVGEILRLMEKEPVVFSVATYSILIQWYSSSGDIGEVEKIFEEMRERKIEIDVYVYSSMISWNCRLGNMKRAFALFDEMAQRNVAPNAHTYGALIGGVCKAGQMEAAEILLEEMQSKGIDLNMIIFNTMIDGYCKRGMMDEALRLQTIMERKGFNADVFTFNILANGLCKLHRVDEALKIFDEMRSKGITGNVATYTSLISGLSKEGRADEAFKLYDEMIKMGLIPDDRVFSALITDIKTFELKLKFGFGLHGRVHITKVHDANDLENPFSGYKIGQTVTARIVSKPNDADSSRNGSRWELSVRPEMALWYKILELRFLLQKPFSSSNRLPEESVKASFCESDETVRVAYADLITSSKETLDSILELQEVCAVLKLEWKKISSKEVSNVLEDNLDQEWSQISRMHNSIASFRDKSINKWQRITQVTTGVAAIKGKHAFNQDISNQVAGYMRDPSRMVKQMQLRKSAVNVFGSVSRFYL